MRHPLDDWRAKADYEQDESEEEQALFQPAPAPNSRLERGILSFWLRSDWCIYGNCRICVAGYGMVGANQ